MLDISCKLSASRQTIYMKHQALWQILTKFAWIKQELIAEEESEGWRWGTPVFSEYTVYVFVFTVYFNLRQGCVFQLYSNTRRGRVFQLKTKLCIPT